MRATAWLCEANDQDPGMGQSEGYAAITKRILKARAGVADAGDPQWVCSQVSFEQYGVERVV